MKRRVDKYEKIHGGSISSLVVLYRDYLETKLGNLKGN